eukprot:scaffold4905_cov121-Isochrysis_galbana.AAC.2
MDTDLSSIPGLEDDYGEQTTSSNRFLEMDLATPVINPINGDVFYTEAVKKFHEIPGIETTPGLYGEGPQRKMAVLLHQRAPKRRTLMPS